MNRTASVHPGLEDGFTLMELIVSMTLLVLVATPFAGAITSSLAAQNLARERTAAEQIALGQVESIRSLPYDSIGLINGNPPGTVQPSRSVVIGGARAVVLTTIAYVSDPTRTSFVTGTDYKRVIVTVKRASDDKQLTQTATFVSPNGRDPYGGVNQGSIRAQIVDVGLNAPITNATVTLGTGPSSVRTDLTDVTGTVVFAGLTATPSSGPQMYYDVTSTIAGYQTLKDDLPPSGAAHTQLAPAQNFSTVIRMYKAATLYVQLKTAAGALFAGPATIVVGSPRQAQAFTVSNGTLTVTQLNGEALVPGLNYTVAAYTPGAAFAPAVQSTVPNSYPVDMTSTFTLALSATAYPTKTLTVRVTNAANAAVPGARVDVTGGPASTFLSATSDSSGTAVFTVPSGSGYAATATGPGAPTGAWSGAVTANTTAAIKES